MVRNPGFGCFAFAGLELHGAGFSYQAGQYILLGWRGEWHPFTLTSAPEESRPLLIRAAELRALLMTGGRRRCISVHIRSPNSLVSPHNPAVLIGSWTREPCMSWPT